MTGSTCAKICLFSTQRYKDGSLLEKQNGDRYIHRTESEKMRKLEEREKKLRYGKRLGIRCSLAMAIWAPL